MTLCFPSTASITVEYQPACLRVRWPDGLAPLFWFSPAGGLYGDRMIPLPSVRSMKLDLQQCELLIIYTACVANDNQ
jgi:hypothetical protein